jgi:ribonucleoside-diphosphate reductase alpha chain
VAPAPVTAVASAPGANRRRLPAERQAITHRFEVAGHEGYITVGLYPNGQPGEIFLKMAKEGSTVSGLMDSFATAISIALQYGVPLKDLVHKFAHVRFEPSGFTGNAEIPIAKSVIDYIFRWLGAKFLDKDERDALGIIDRTATDTTDGGSDGPAVEPSQKEMGTVEPPTAAATAPAVADETPVAPVAGNGHAKPTLVERKGDAVALAFGTKRLAFEIADAPSCSDCGSIMVRNGSCYKCVNCGSTSGCS